MELPAALTSVLDQGLESIYGLREVFEPTVVLVPSFVTTHVQNLADSIGFDVETLNYTLGLFLCYPLGMIMNLLPYGTMRHLFSFFFGAFLLQFTIGVQWIHQLINCVIAYVMFLTLPRRLSCQLVPTFVLLYLVFGHLHRQYINYLGWDLDFTGAQMILTQKLYMMAFNLYDGELLAQNKPSRAAQKCAPFALHEMPSLLEFLGYSFCFANILAGPAYEFISYKHACDGTLLYAPDGTPKGKIPSNVWPSLKPFLISLYCMGAFVVIGSKFPLQDPTDPQKNLPVVVSAEFLQQPWFQRMIYLMVGLFFHRHKYYFAWKNAEGANNIWFVGFEGFDEKGEPKGWDISNNVDIIEFETAPSLSVLSRSWNKKTSLWLNRYVYIRTNGSLLAVYSLSAFWHGFYPGYYLFFLSIPLLTVCERLGRKKISPLFSASRFSLYGILCTLVTAAAASYMVSAFVLLALDRSWAIWKSFYFAGHVLCVIFYLLVSNLPTPKTKES
ncbi:lysophospholipid acyltransferase [Fistulifera solaris]|uniref:Lysophospholipid acyltransferase n=1 Tax=Fistulifera solaris TaxID=1519565 RepID=A0A1Z5K2E6_FISSO|nr:lysophospholipid acyltransferase [Fistulifera solaris]|eukprot:GAX20424.1 lysophospholipid acyltransferase [Fistulifera solaris]